MSWYEDTTPNFWLWVLLGIPAILGWAGAGVFWLLEPRLIAEVTQMQFAYSFAGIWYGIMLILLTGWIGLLAIASSL